VAALGALSELCDHRSDRDHQLEDDHNLLKRLSDGLDDLDRDSGDRGYCDNKGDDGEDHTGLLRVNLWRRRRCAVSAAALIQAFDFESQAVRVVLRGEQPWFVAADVCRVLEIANARDAVSTLEDDEKMTVANTDSHSGKRGGAQCYNVISESGLYALIFKSRKAEAKRFRKWVTSEVLPAIRKDGEYRAAQATANTERGQLARLRRLLLETAEDVRSGKLTPGKAQAIAITGQRYLETLKLEAEAMGYENVLGLPSGKATDGFLQKPRSGDELLQDLSQPTLPGAETDEPALPSDASAVQEGVERTEPETGGDAREGLQAPEMDSGDGSGADA
jgi:prophage antirepressor-like protein